MTDLESILFFCFVLFLYFILYYIIFFYFLALQYCIGFAIYQNESATGREYIKMQRHYFANKGPSSQGFSSHGFSSSHLWM